MITLGGFPLLIPDEGGKLAGFLRRHAPWCDFSSIFAGSADGCPRRRRYEQDKGVGLPAYNWPAPPPLAINSLYWPTGATRFARGLFLATRSVAQLIVATAQGEAIELKWGDDADQRTVVTNVHVLPPRPISVVSGDTDDSVWLIPVVDDRYWWQSQPMEEPDVDAATTWANMFGAIDGYLGTSTGGDEVHADYLSPDKTEFNRPFSSAAAMLDAVCASTGQRLVRQLDGTVEAFNPPETFEEPTAETRVAGAAYGSVVSGSCPDVPATVEVVCRKVKYFGQLADEQVYTYSKDAPGASVDGKAHTVYSAACADFSAGSGTPDNDTILDALATKIAEDFYAWRQFRFAYTLAGAVDWTFTGFEDAVVWEFGAQTASGEMLAQTRVWSLAPDVVTTEHAAGDPDVFIIEPEQEGIASEDIAAETSGTVRIWIGVPGSETNSTWDVEAYNRTGLQADDTTRVWLRWGGEGWYVHPLECPA